MEQKYSKEIEFSIQNTIEYPHYPHKEKIIVDDLDSVSAIFKYYSGKTALLNFASYVSPGGGFIRGNFTQEEALCHKSTLYNVLSQFQDSFYEINKNYLNHHLYENKALYSKDILFIQDNRKLKCDVITCAAPNYRRAKHEVTYKENLDTLESRIKFIIDIVEEQKVETLILGAFGCGVFEQDPNVVAPLFKKHLKKYLSESKDIETIIFAIPDGNNSNYITFKRVFS